MPPDKKIIQKTFVGMPPDKRIMQKNFGKTR
jgi:hypothetical protein